MLSGLLFNSVSGFSYDTDDFEQYKEKYKDDIAVVLNHDQTVSIEINSSTKELEIYETDYEEVLYIDEVSKFYTTQNIYTSDFFEDIVSIEVTVYNPSGKKVKLDDDDFRIVDSPPSSWVFHDDDKELIFELPDLGSGYRTVVEYTKRVKRPEFFDVFHFMSVYPVEQASVVISHPKNVNLSFFEQNLEGENVTRLSEEGKGGMTNLIWKLTDVKKYRTEDGSTNTKNHVPHLIAQITSYSVNGEEIKLVGTPDELHDFFQEFLLLRDKDKESKNKSEMNAVIRDITEGMETDLEKIDTVFRWVQANIKYIAFEDGINGYVPRSCNEVMNNRYGDCKDMGNLLVEMLDFAGVEGAHVAWVGTRDIPYLMSEIPSPLTCNHVICVVDKPGGSYYYLDATSSEGGYLLPPRGVQSKELLIHNGDKDFTLFKVPAVHADTNYIRSVIKYHLDDDDSLRGSGVDYYGGYEREGRTYYLSNLDNEDLEEYVKDMVLGGYNRYTMNGYEIENLENKNEVLSISYDFSVDNLFIEDGEDLILNPVLFKPRVSRYNTEDHQLTRFKRNHRTIDYWFEFEIPDGYKLKSLPETVNYDHELFTFIGSYELQGNTLLVKMKYQYHLLEIPTELYPEWNEFSAAINKATIQNIILQKK